MKSLAWSAAAFLLSAPSTLSTVIGSPASGLPLAFWVVPAAGQASVSGSPLILVLVLASAYLLGSIPFSYLVVQRRLGQDVRQIGSGNAGATNVMRVTGKAPALLVLFLDVAKGVVAVLLPRALGFEARWVALAAVLAVVGHVLPVWLGFRGGKGVATAAGALGTLLPAAMISALALFVLVVAVRRIVSLASVVAAVAVAPLALLWAYFRWSPEPSRWSIVAAACIGLLVVAKHHTNIRRIWRGEEPRLGSNPDAESDPAPTEETR